MAKTNPDFGVIAIFKHLDTLCRAIEKIRERGDFAGHEVLSPTSYHEIEHACGFGASPVRYFTLIGALTGTSFGFGLPLLCDWDWPLVVGGKTAGVYSLPAYVVIGFECTILFGVLATILGMLVMGRLPNPKRRVLDVRTTDDHFGIFVPGARTDGQQAHFLKECGATEVRST
jgi:molybdopterin-containing oxidoreductase family membrane subunit